MIGWVFFRADDLPHAAAYLAAMAGMGAASTREFHVGLWLEGGGLVYRNPTEKREELRAVYEARLAQSRADETWIDQLLGFQPANLLVVNAQQSNDITNAIDAGINLTVV